MATKGSISNGGKSHVNLPVHISQMWYYMFIHMEPTTIWMYITNCRPDTHRSHLRYTSLLSNVQILNLNIRSTSFSKSFKQTSLHFPKNSPQYVCLCVCERVYQREYTQTRSRIFLPSPGEWADYWGAEISVLPSHIYVFMLWLQLANWSCIHFYLRFPNSSPLNAPSRVRTHTHTRNVTASDRSGWLVRGWSVCNWGILEQPSHLASGRLIYIHSAAHIHMAPARRHSNGHTRTHTHSHTNSHSNKALSFCAVCIKTKDKQHLCLNNSVPQAVATSGPSVWNVP